MAYNRVMVNGKKFGRRYPWRKWFILDRFVLRRGRDYDCKTFSMAQAVYKAAARMRINIDIDIDEEDGALHVEIADAKKETRHAKAK